MPHPLFDIRPITAQQTHALRHAVLRPNQTLSEMVFDGDALPGTLHLGAWLKGGPENVIGIVTLTPAPMPGYDAVSASTAAGSVIDPSDFRLRGMAVAPAYQGRGIGRALVEHALSAVQALHGRRIWCNARVAATGFYQRIGFQTHGQRFEIAGIGPHVRMHIAAHNAAR